MIKVKVAKQSNYAVSSPTIKGEIKKLLKEKGVTSDAQVSIAIVDEKKMLALSKTYLKDNQVHNVLSFPHSEAKNDFKYPDDGIIRLGEIVVCYPRAVEEAKKENKLIDEKIVELVNHGALHLLGIHHN